MHLWGWVFFFGLVDVKTTEGVSFFIMIPRSQMLGSPSQFLDFFSKRVDFCFRDVGLAFSDHAKFSDSVLGAVPLQLVEVAANAG